VSEIGILFGRAKSCSPFCFSLLFIASFILFLFKPLALGYLLLYALLLRLCVRFCLCISLYFGFLRLLDLLAFYFGVFGGFPVVKDLRSRVSNFKTR
jgi:hypothetical protein